MMSAYHDQNADDWDASLHQEDDEVNVDTYAPNDVTGESMKGRKTSTVKTTEAHLNQNADDWASTVTLVATRMPVTNKPKAQSSYDFSGEIEEEDVDEDAEGEELAESLWSTVHPGDEYQKEGVTGATNKGRKLVHMGREDDS